MSATAELQTAELQHPLTVVLRPLPLRDRVTLDNLRDQRLGHHRASPLLRIKKSFNKQKNLYFAKGVQFEIEGFFPH
jgi:hypothetical protein